MALQPWLDQVPNLDFGREKQALLDILSWGQAHGWNRVDTRGLEFNSRTATDIAMENGDKTLRVAVQPKARTTQGMIKGTYFLRMTAESERAMRIHLTTHFPQVKLIP